MTLDDIDGTTDDDDDWDKNDKYLDDDDHDKDDNGDYLYDSDDDKDGNERECFLRIPADRICRPAKKCSVVKFGQRCELKLVTMIVIIIMIFFVMIFLFIMLFIMVFITCERRELKG